MYRDGYIIPCLKNIYYWYFKTLDNSEVANIIANELAEMLGVSVGHVKKGLEQKMDTMVERELYTKSKTAPTEEEREKSRQEYLDRRGIPENFRW